MLLFKLVDKGLGFISTLVLARLLLPADFGLVAMAMAVVAATQLLSAFGFDTALIQRQDARREHFDTAWTFNVAFGAGIAILLTTLAYPVARFYGDPRLVPILLVLAGSAVISGLENIGTVAFRKELDFRSEFRFLALKRVTAFAVTVALALILQNYWALVAGTFAGRVLGAAISYRLHPYRPRLSLAARRDLMHFSQWILIANLISFLQTRSADFILGRTVGAHALGIYSVALEISVIPATEVIAPINRAVFPAYTQLSTQLEALRERFRTVYGLICMIAFPVSATIFAVADPAVRALLGEKWIEAVPIIRVFCIAGLIGALQSNLYLLVIALGHPRANTALSAAVLVVSLPTIVWASQNYGLQGAVFAQLAASAIGGFGAVLVMIRLSRIAPSAFVTAAWRPALASAIALAGAYGTDQTVLADVPVAAQLACLLLSMALLFPATVAGLWWAAGRPSGAERDLLHLLRQRLPPRQAT